LSCQGITWDLPWAPLPSKKQSVTPTTTAPRGPTAPRGQTGRRGPCICLHWSSFHEPRRQIVAEMGLQSGQVEPFIKKGLLFWVPGRVSHLPHLI
jgi:hypothetical protein